MRIGYCRVSTKSAEQTASIEVQAKRLADYGCDRVLVDHGISGFREGGRKGSTFPELIDLILDRTATEVIVPNFDRTQRRAKWGSQLLDALETTGCRLLELDTGTWLDPANNPTDVLMAQIRSAVQENESPTSMELSCLILRSGRLPGFGGSSCGRWNSTWPAG
jgi:DNA invertase Pin-like site-specific DNA recombinase